MHRGKVRIAILALSCASVASGGCHERGQRGRASGGVVDSLGRRVVVARAPGRIATLSPAATEIAFALGCGDRVVLRDSVSNHPPAAQKVPATDAFRLSAEHIAGFRPQLVLLSHGDRPRIAALEGAGMKVAVFMPKTVEQVLDSVLRIGELCHAKGASRRLVRRLRRRLARVAKRVAGRRSPRVYVEIDGGDPSKPWTTGGASFVHDVVERAGGHNLFGAVRRGYFQTSAEEVIGGSPEVIVDVSGRRAARARLGRRPGWRGIAAVRKGRVIDDIDADALTRPGPRIAAALEQLARALHPAAFGGSR